MEFISIILQNLTIVLVVLAFIFAFFCKNKASKGFCYWLLVYLVFFTVGIQGIWGFIFHVFFPNIASSSIGWANSPFEFEIGIANLALGVSGLLSFVIRKRYFWLACIIFAGVFYFGAGVGHVYQLLVHKDYATDNAGVILYTDLITPILFWICYSKIRWKKSHE